MDYGADELYTAMSEAALSGWDRWNEAWGSPLYHQDGFLLLSTEAMQPGGFEHESFALLRRRGHAPERIRPGDLEWPVHRMGGGEISGRLLQPARRLGRERPGARASRGAGRR